MVVKFKRNLPIEIESNIFSRLPVKTLIKFRSVKKSWYSLVSDPFFINMHRHHQTHSNNNDDNLLLMKYYTGNHANIVVVNTCLNVHSTFEDPNPRYAYRYNIVGSSNGLVCIHGLCYLPSHHNHYLMVYISLWNPSLRINKIIYHKRRSYEDRDFANPCVGFGFHNQTNDYKVIRFQPRLPKAVKIYSFSSDSWRKVECADSDLWRDYIVDVDERFGVYVNDAPLIPNGTYCWSAKTTKKDKAEIVSFDTGDEVFNEMMLPPIRNIYAISLFIYKDLLAVLDTLYDSDKSLSFCYVWVMKEYNDPKSWIQICTFDMSYGYWNARFGGIILEAELVLITRKFDAWENEVCVYDIDKMQTNTRFTKDIRISKYAGYVSSFTESLVLLDVKNKRKRYRSN